MNYFLSYIWTTGPLILHKNFQITLKGCLCKGILLVIQENSLKSIYFKNGFQIIFSPSYQLLIFSLGVPLTICLMIWRTTISEEYLKEGLRKKRNSPFSIKLSTKNLTNDALMIFSQLSYWVTVKFKTKRTKNWLNERTDQCNESNGRHNWDLVLHIRPLMKKNETHPLWFLRKCIFQRVVEALFFVSFNIIISHIFSGNFIEIAQLNSFRKYANFSVNINNYSGFSIKRASL